jgi:DNA/RNA-binding domain of Phe-tRNA-synthetase-like protein
LSDEQHILCWLESRQAEKTKIRAHTRYYVSLLQGNQQTPCSYLDRAARELRDVFATYCSCSSRVYPCHEAMSLIT